jgi:hypothetical protein
MGFSDRRKQKISQKEKLRNSPKPKFYKLRKIIDEVNIMPFFRQYIHSFSVK